MCSSAIRRCRTLPQPCGTWSLVRWFPRDVAGPSLGCGGFRSGTLFAEGVALAVGLSLRCVPTGTFQVSLLIAGPALEILVPAVGSRMSFSLASVAGVPVGTWCLLPLSLFACVSFPFAAARGGLGEKSGPGVTVRPAHLIHGALPTQYTARCPLKALHVSTSQWPTWKNTHTLNITLDDYKEITSYMFFL